MRQIGFIDEEPDAQRFGDYLLTQGVRNNIEQMHGGAWAVWVEDDDLVDRGQAELDQFRANPADPKYQATGQATKIRKQEKKKQERRATQYTDVRTRWGQPSQLFRPVTIALAAVSIIVSIGGTKLGLVKGPPSPAENAFYIAPVRDLGDGFIGWDHLDALTGGQVWRAVTPMFLHFHPLHLLFNMFWLVDLGSMIETRRGSIRLLLLVLFTAALSNVAEYYLPNPSDPNPQFGGMSGVNYALFAYVWVKGRYQPQLGMGISPQSATIMMVWLVICFLPGFNARVANVAHVVGLISGAAVAFLPYAFARLRRGR